MRNIANVISENDQCLNTCKIVNKIVLQYGLDHLKLSNIIVVGHYNCGGVSLAADLSKVRIVRVNIGKQPKYRYRYKDLVGADS